MNYIQKVKKEFSKIKPELTKPKDFDDFWEERLIASKNKPLDFSKTKVDYPSDIMDVYDIKYSGFDETKIEGLLLLPQKAKAHKVPCLVHYHGFSGDKGVPSDFAHFINLGLAVLSVDIRGQGGNTRDMAKYKSGMTQNLVADGILSPHDYYFVRVYIDCIRALDFACKIDEVDTSKLIVHGGSQGGALGMAMAALDDRPWLAIVDVPSNTNLAMRLERKAGAFGTLQEYLKIHPDKIETVLDTLSYIDTMNMADKITCKVLASVGLSDPVCPPDLYMATYNRIKGEKELYVYPYHGHEGGGRIHREIKIKYIYDHLKESEGK